MNVDDLIAKVRSYYPDADFQVLKDAFQFSKEKHGDQTRRSGEPYILHPVLVAEILSELHMDLPTIVTGVLHDTLEDTAATRDEIQERFGSEILELVEGVTKISKITFRTSHEKQAENFRKMLVAMAKDIRVVIVKLADRLHNMRTLQHLSPEKQVEIAQETIDIYAPIANRLGMSWMKIELEDLCFRYLKPEAYFKLVKLVAQKKQERQAYVDDVKKMLVEKLNEAGLEKFQVLGRPKHFYSIYKKMEQGNLAFEQIHDLIAFRIIVHDVTHCYGVLGVVHSLWKPVPGRFKDFIAMPKPNLYRSLHTTVIGPSGHRVEIQIRTLEMDEIAEYGVAAHWKYKEKNHNIRASEQFEWLHKLVQWKDESDPVLFMESVKLDLFQSEVFVFTPAGDVMEFPSGSTPLDFAYAIHTDIGNKCMGAKVNDRLVPLRYEMKSGDTIEIVTSPTQRPSKDWLKFAKTSRAKSKIRAFMKIQEQKEAKAIGSDVLEREFKKYRKNFTDLSRAGKLEKVATELGCANADELLIKVGYGLLSTEKVLSHFMTDEEKAKLQKDENLSILQKIFRKAAKKSKSQNAIRVEGSEDVLIRFAKCCNPLPGDPIVGFITRGRGVSVHAVDCNKILDAESDRKLDVQWSEHANLERQVRIKIICVDEPGALMSMSKSIASEGVNIYHAECTTTRDKKAVNVFDISVRDATHLRKVMQELEKLKFVISVERVRSA